MSGCWQVFSDGWQDLRVFPGQQFAHVFQGFHDRGIREIPAVSETPFSCVWIAEPDVMMTDGDDVVMCQNVIGYASRIDECPVGTVQVHHECGTAVANQQQVMAADKFASD